MVSKERICLRKNEELRKWDQILGLIQRSAICFQILIPTDPHHLLWAGILLITQTAQMGPKWIGPSPLPTGGSAGLVLPSAKQLVQGEGLGHVHELWWKSGVLVRRGMVHPHGTAKHTAIWAVGTVGRTIRPRGIERCWHVVRSLSCNGVVCTDYRAGCTVSIRCFHVTQQAWAHSMIWPASRQGKGGRRPHLSTRTTRTPSWPPRQGTPLNTKAINPKRCAFFSLTKLCASVTEADTNLVIVVPSDHLRPVGTTYVLLLRWLGGRIGSLAKVLNPFKHKMILEREGSTQRVNTTPHYYSTRCLYTPLPIYHSSLTNEWHKLPNSYQLLTPKL